MKKKPKSIKVLKWFLSIITIFIVLIIASIIYFYHTSFKLKEWEYSEKKTQQNELVLPKRPNILLLVAEDMSLRVGAFGDSLANTPNLDKLASKGIKYPNVFTTAGVCAPSRAALITGMYQISIGAQHMRTGSRPKGGYYCVPPKEVKAFPEVLRAAGYYTFNIAKEDYQFSGLRTGTGPFTIWDAEDDPNLWRSRRDDQPFFGMINFMETHETGLFSPLGTWPHSFLHFVIQLIRPAMLMSKSLGIEGKEVEPNKISLPPYYPDTKIVREDLAQFYKNINAMDAVIGEILDRLEKDRLASSTIVIWTTDHGDCLPRAKRDLTDSGIKVPMIIYWPEAYRPQNLKPGEIDYRLISFVDIAPTILDMAKAPKPEYLQGVSLLSDSIRKYIYAAKDRIDEVYYRQRAVRDKRFKYIKSWYPQVPDGVHIKFRDNIEMVRNMWELLEEQKLDKEQVLWFEPTGKERLYDIVKDPYELNNLVNDTSYADVLNKMRNELDNWLNSIKDWGEITEDQMVEKFYPNGKRGITPIPKIGILDNKVTIISSQNASIGYRINNGPWLLYTRPFSVTKGQKITAKAVRYGWEESDEVVLINN